MEASDTSGQQPDPALVGDNSTDTPQDQSQNEQPQDDSQLTTPQPDQPAPNEADRQQTDDSQVSQPDGPTSEVGPSGQPAEGVTHPPQFPTGAQQNDAAVQQERERETARRAHNARTGGGEIRENEVQDARQEHNDRTGGGQVPGTSESAQESEQPES